MSQICIKAGETIAETVTICGLPGALAWQAASTLRDDGGDVVAELTTTLTQASDYSTSGDWVLTLYATAEATAAWLPPGSPFAHRRLIGDVKFACGADDPVVRSETFAVVVSQPLT